MSKTSSLLLIAALGFGLVGCTEEPSGASAEDVEAMRSEIGRLERRLGQMENEIASVKRRASLRGRDRVEIPVAAAPAPATGAATGAAPTDTEEGGEDEPVTTVTAGEFQEFLSTENGQQVFAAAMREYQQKQSEDRRTRMVSAMVEPFAKKAYLSQDQAERMSEVLETAMQTMRDTWQSMRDVQPEQRGAQVAVNIQRSREIREEADMELEGLLSATQYEMYQEDASTFFGMPRGGRGGGDRPQR